MSISTSPSRFWRSNVISDLPEPILGQSTSPLPHGIVYIAVFRSIFSNSMTPLLMVSPHQVWKHSDFGDSKLEVLGRNDNLKGSPLSYSSLEEEVRLLARSHLVLYPSSSKSIPYSEGTSQSKYQSDSFHFAHDG